MHEFDYSVPIFVTRIQGMCIVVTLDIVSNVLYVPRVEHPVYPGCDRFKTVSKDKLISSFCECPSDWGERQFTPCMAFAKGPKFLNIVMTFVLYPLSHYNSIIEPCARFLLFLLEHLTIDFPSHFILSIIYVHRDMVTRDKLIFSSAIKRILRHFFVPFPSFDHFHVMCAIDATIVKRSKVQFHLRWAGSTAPTTPSVPSTFAPSTSAGGVTLDAIMAQLQCMDACLDTLTTEMYQVNTHVGRIVRQQACLCGFVESPSPPSEASEDDDDSDDDDDDEDEDEDGDASSSSTNEMST